jgi:putative hydrolase of the HAD superfamily
MRVNDLTLVLFDIGGVLGSNGWDREQRTEAVRKFGLDREDFEYRHEETVGDLESGRITLDEYLKVTVFGVRRSFTQDEFVQFMLAQSTPWPDSIRVAEDLAATGRVRMATLNNESEVLNAHRINAFGLCPVFPTFFSSCWLGVRKPTAAIYNRVLGMTQTRPDRVLFVDDRTQNLAPAKELGMRTVLFESAAQLRSDLVKLNLLAS